jgi:formylglycine-generating enzyme required for sulfatase activity
VRSTPQAIAAGLVLSLAAALPGTPAAAQEAPPQGMTLYTETIPDTNIKFEMVPIPGGEFTIGSPEDEENRNPDEGPQRRVKIAPFWMGKHEVTWDEYDIFRKRPPEEPPPGRTDAEQLADAVTRPTPPYADETFGMGRKNQPVICITHHAAMEYCRWLSARTGKLYRLPTEAEWEYACRAGTTGPYSFGDESIDDYAWYVENAEKPQRVGKKKPNPFGLHDMHGNAAEWVLDHYVKDIYSTYPENMPIFGPVVLPDAKEYPYVVRGGSWDDDPEALRSAARRASNLDWSQQDPQRPQSIWWHTDATFVGFRLVRPLEEQENLRGLKSQVVKGKTTR